MSVISNSFKRNAALRLAKSLNIEDDKQKELTVEIYKRAFDCAESMFTEQD